jgi:hypothetical protein
LQLFLISIYYLKQEDKMKPIEQLLSMYGSPTKVGRALGVSRQVVENWVKSGYIPYERATQVHKKTGGAIKNKQIWLAADEARGIK